MAGLSVIFRAVDEISSRFDAMVSAGTRALDSFDRIEAAADSSYEVISEGAAGAADAMERAASATDYWTDRIGNYDREAMQAIYSIEELVEMGYMSEEALNHLGDALDDAADDLEDFGDEAEDAGDDAEDFGERSQSAVEGLDKLLATVGIVAALTTIGSAFMGCSQASAEFETNVAMVSTVADTAALSASELSAQISELSMDTARNVNELADASYNAISAGVATEDAVETVGEAAKLATAGFTTSSSALSVLTTALNAYGLEASEVTNISDSLITSQNLGVLTIDQMASSMGKAISTASAYSVDLYNLEAGYISLTKAGISVEESTTYISSMFNELGSASSKVATVITEETGMSFGQLMNAGYSLADVLDIVYESADRDAEAMMNLWGSAEAGKAANAIINQGLDTFNSNLEKLENSAGTTQAAYEAMTNTTAYSTERLENSFHNLSIAIGDDLNPVVSRFQNGIADITDGFTKLINEHSAISAVLVGVTVGIGVVTLGVSGYTLAAKAAALATTAWTAVMNMNPVFLAVTAITALTAGLITLSTVMEENTERAENLTAVSRLQAEELETLNAEYERVVELQGMDSKEAIELEHRINSLNEEYEASKQTIEEYAAALQASMDAYAEMTERHQEQEASMNHEGATITYMVSRLEELANQTDLTTGEQQEMLAIIKGLNEEVPGLSLSYNTLTGTLSQTSDAIRNLAEAEIASKKYEEYNEQLIEKIKMRASMEDEIAKAIENQEIAQENLNKLYQDEQYERYLALVEEAQSWTASSAPRNIPRELTEFGAELSAAEQELENYKKAAEQATMAMEENEEEIIRISEEMARLSGVTEETVEATDGYSEAISVIDKYQEQIMELCNAYDIAYESAISSVEGQYSLWDKADAVVATSRKDIEDVLQSQIDYWNSYNENMVSLTERANDIEGLSNMLADLANGSEESAAMLAGLANMNDTDLSAVVQQYNDLNIAQSETAVGMAELETEFSENLEKMQIEMDDMVEGMDLSVEAKANAKATMDAYVSEIHAGVAKAQTAINSLSFANNTLSGGGYHEYATGTLDAEPGLALVGEEGPELVNFGGGEVVYTAAETSNILARGNENKDFFVSPPVETGDGDDFGDKTITLRIEGAGEMKVSGGGANKEDIVNVLVENMRGVLMDILRQEIMEEGEMSYEF